MEKLREVSDLLLKIKIKEEKLDHLIQNLARQGMARPSAKGCVIDDPFWASIVSAVQGEINAMIVRYSQRMDAIIKANHRGEEL